MITIPNQSSVAKAYEQFDDAGRMRPSPYYDRIVDVMEELVKINRPGSRHCGCYLQHILRASLREISHGDARSLTTPCRTILRFSRALA